MDQINYIHYSILTNLIFEAINNHVQLSSVFFFLSFFPSPISGVSLLCQELGLYDSAECLDRLRVNSIDRAARNYLQCSLGEWFVEHPLISNCQGYWGICHCLWNLEVCLLLLVLPLCSQYS